jgi:hypothetical protein
MITQERAREIMSRCQELAVHGPWCDQMDKVLTPEENAQILQHWESLPGTSCYMDSFFDFLNGTVGELG